MPSVFISHSSHDDSFVGELTQFFKGLKYDSIFNDSHALKPDECFWERILCEIARCDAFVVVLSEHSVKSAWVEREIQEARRLHKQVIPIRIDRCQPPVCLNAHNLVEFRHLVGPREIAPSRITRHAPTQLFGREDELKALDVAWSLDAGANVYTLVAWGGVGKTSLVAHWVATRFINRNWPGVLRYFDWSFYSQGTGESRQASADLFLNKALEFFGDPNPAIGSAWQRGERLAKLVQQQRTLLVLDGIEPLQYPPTDRSGQAGRLKDQGMQALLQTLAMDNPGLCIVTSRETLTDLQAWREFKAPEHKVSMLAEDAAIRLLRHLQLVGSDDELTEAWKAVNGHALTLQLLGRFIADAHADRDIRHFREVHFEDADRERQGRSAFKVMVAYEKWLQGGADAQQRELAILRLTGLFDHPISGGCLQELRAAPVIAGLTDSVVGVSEPGWNVAVERLVELGLVSRCDDGLDAHPLIRQYFAQQLRTRLPEAFKIAHGRIFDYLCKETPHQPDDLHGLEPLYQAVLHGCLAERHQEACVKIYRDRILRGNVNYSTFKLGALGADLAAVAAFFDEQWRKVSDHLSSAAQSWVLGEAAFSLRALGRLTEARQPMRVGLDMAIQRTDWKNAATHAANLCELEVSAGELSQAVEYGQQAVEFADRSGDLFQKMSKRATAAHALHQLSGLEPDSVLIAGESAGKLFETAEMMQRKDQPLNPRLYSLRGFQHCELLLTPVEYDVWHFVGHYNPLIEWASKQIGVDPAVSACGIVATLLLGQCLMGQHDRSGKLVPLRSMERESVLLGVEERAEYALNIAKRSNRLLDIGLYQLMIARIAVYRWVITFDWKSPLVVPHLESAIDILRQANAQHHLPKALLTAALVAHLQVNDQRAAGLLDEVQLIAERGPMPLYLADCYLHRARLFRDAEALQQAKNLIQKHHYGRRFKELANAEES